MIVDEEGHALQHYGTKGMKWGVRRRSSESSPKPAPRISSDYKKTQAIRGRHPSTLSNKQLKDLNERLNLEQNYKRLHPDKVTKGRDRVKTVLGTLGLGVTAYSTFTSPAAKALIDVGKKVIK